MERLSSLIYSRIIPPLDKDLDNYCYDRFGILDDVPFKFEMPKEDNTSFYDACLERCKELEGCTFLVNNIFGLYVSIIMLRHNIEFNVYDNVKDENILKFLSKNKVQITNSKKSLVIFNYGGVLFLSKRTNNKILKRDEFHNVREELKERFKETSLQLSLDYYLSCFNLTYDDFETYEDLVRFFDCCFGYYAFGSILPRLLQRNHKVKLNTTISFFHTQKFTDIWFTQFLNVSKTGSLRIILEMNNLIQEYVGDVKFSMDFRKFRKNKTVVLWI